jgi:hopanoid biosynthesis associated protein HpnK
MMAARRLIVNADDFALTEGVNLAVLDGHLHGIITSATLMANGRAFESAVEIARGADRLGVGVHLNLVEGDPVAGASAVPSLVTARGAMANPPGRLAVGLLRRRIRISDVERELRAQIEKVLDAGIRPTHLDGHKHAHLWPSVFGVVTRLAAEYRIPAIRCAVETGASWRTEPGSDRATRRALRRQYAAGRALGLFATAGRRRLAAAGLSSADRIVGITHTGYLSQQSLERLIGSLRAGTSELMCHPGYVDEALRAAPTRLIDSRRSELDALTSPETRARIEREAIELITYGDLQNAL